MNHTDNISVDEGIRLRVPSPGNKGKDFVFMKGTGPDDLLCGSCKKTILEKMGKGQVQGVSFRCPKCGAYNLT